MNKYNDSFIKEKYDIRDNSKYLLLIVDFDSNEEYKYPEEYDVPHAKQKIETLKDLLYFDIKEFDKSTITIDLYMQKLLLRYIDHYPEPLSVIDSVKDFPKYFMDVKFIDSNDSPDIDLQEYDEVYVFGEYKSNIVADIRTKNNLRNPENINKLWYAVKKLSFHELDESTVLIYFYD